jgi:hypothetical protein
VNNKATAFLAFATLVAPTIFTRAFRLSTENLSPFAKIALQEMFSWFDKARQQIHAYLGVIGHKASPVEVILVVI